MQDFENGDVVGKQAKGNEKASGAKADGGAKANGGAKGGHRPIESVVKYSGDRSGIVYRGAESEDRGGGQ